MLEGYYCFIFFVSFMNMVKWNIRRQMAFFTTRKNRGPLQFRGTWPGASPADPGAKSPRWGHPTAGNDPSGTEGPPKGSRTSGAGVTNLPSGEDVERRRTPTAPLRRSSPRVSANRPTSVSIFYLHLHYNTSFPQKGLGPAPLVLWWLSHSPTPARASSSLAEASEGVLTLTLDIPPLTLFLGNSPWQSPACTSDLALDQRAQDANDSGGPLAFQPCPLESPCRASKFSTHVRAGEQFRGLTLLILTL